MSASIAALALQQISDTEQAEVDAALDEEIDLRVDEILTGKVELVDGDETRRLAQQRRRLAASERAILARASGRSRGVSTPSLV